MFLYLQTNTLKTMKQLFFAGIMLSLVSCSNLKITALHDNDVDFTQLKTYSYYGWTEEGEGLNPFDKRLIESSFAKEFAKRNFTYVDSGGDIVISLFVVVNQKTSRSAYTNHYGGGPYGYGRYGYYYGYNWGWGMGHSSTTYHEYDYYDGTLVCDVFLASSKKIVWQAVASSTINENPKKREKSIPRAVAYIMRKFPVKPQR